MVSGRGPGGATFLRHKADASGVTSIRMGSRSFRAVVQSVPADPVRNGCRWAPTFTLTIPADWPSGMYSALLRDEDVCEFHVTFVVKPAPERRSGLAAAGRFAGLPKGQTEAELYVELGLRIG